MSDESVIGKSTVRSKTVGESDVYLFAGITGDLADYHVNEQFMEPSVYGGRIAHGVLILGLASTTTTDFWSAHSQTGNTVSYGYDHVRFVNAVRINDTVTSTYTVKSFDEERQMYLAELVVTNQHGDVCLVAEHLTKKLAFH